MVKTTLVISFGIAYFENHMQNYIFLYVIWILSKRSLSFIRLKILLFHKSENYFWIELLERYFICKSNKTLDINRWTNKHTSKFVYIILFPDYLIIFQYRRLIRPYFWKIMLTFFSKVNLYLITVNKNLTDS